MDFIRTIARREAAFVYHMPLRVWLPQRLRRGARSLHRGEDLAAIRAMEPLLTVAGSSYQGALYWPLIAVPAAPESPTGDFCRDYPATRPPESPRTHIFGTGRGMDRAVRFVLHEYAIFLLQGAPERTPASSEHRYWAYPEALADCGPRPHGLSVGIALPSEITAHYSSPVGRNPGLTPGRSF